MENKHQNIPFFDHCFDKGRLKKWITKIYLDTILTEDLTMFNFIETLKNLGYSQATQAGVSIGIDDLRIPPKKTELLQSIEYNVQETTRQFGMNRITALENFQNFIDIWHRTSETLKTEVVSNFEATDTLNPVYMMAFSGARGNLSQVSQLVGMRGFMSDPEGQIIDYPIRSNFREGLTLTEYVISCYGARKGLVDTALRTADAGYLTRRLVDVAHEVIITKYDCKTKQGIWLTSIQDNFKTLYPLEKRLVGRVLASNIYFPYIDEETDEAKKIFWTYFSRNQQLDPLRAKLLAAFFKKVLIRSPLRCIKRKRLCQLCYGWTLPHGHLAPIGEAVGILAAQSIGEPGTQLTMRTFHTGGVFSGALSDENRAPYSGTVRYPQPVKGAMFRSVSGQLAFLAKAPGIITIEPFSEQLDYIQQKPIFELEFPAFSTLFFKNGQKISANEAFIEFPKLDQKTKGTVFNTYTYYSKLSGLLEVYKTTADASKNEDILTHAKLPKLHPFFEEQKYKSKKFQSLRISAGQIYQTNNSDHLLAGPGDLVNRNTILSRKQLINLDQKLNLGITEVFQNRNSLKLTAYKNILNLPLGLTMFHSKIGYTYSFNLKNVPNSVVSYIIPYLTYKQNLPALQDRLLMSNYPNLRDGFLFVPINKKRKKSHFVSHENIVFFNKRSLQKSIYELKQLNKTTLIDFQKALSNIFFYSPHRKYCSSIIFSRPFSPYENILEDEQLKTKGKTLSNYRNKFSDQIKLKGQVDGQFLKKDTLVNETFNLQNEVNYSYSPFEGFIRKKGISQQRHFKLKKQVTRASNKMTYWLRKEVEVLKKGWPYLKCNQKVVLKRHKKLNLLGQSILDDLNFLSKTVYTEWITIITRKQNHVLYFQKRPIVLRKKFQSLRFVHIPTYALIVLFNSTQQYDVLALRDPKTLKTYKQFGFKNETFDKFKKYLYCEANNKTNTHKQFLKLFTILNKTRKTHKRTSELALNPIRREMHLFQDTFSCRKYNYLDSINHVQEIFRPIQPLQFIIKIPATQRFPLMVHEVSKSSFMTSSYSVILANYLDKQIYFKNQLSSLENLYLKKNCKEIAGNSIMFQLHSLSPFTGELMTTQSKTIQNAKTSNALVLTFKDTFTIKIPFETNELRVGDLVSYGQKISSTKLSPYTAKILQITPTLVQCQQVEKALVSPNSHFFGEHNQLVRKTARIFTQPYPRLQMGDIVQGIPKIEEFFEARQTKEGEIFDGNLNNRLKVRFNFYRKKYSYPIFLAARKSVFEIQNYIIESIFHLYTSQGISISDKHLEIIVRQMTNRVMVTDFWTRGISNIPWKHPLPCEICTNRSMEAFLARYKNSQRQNVCYEPIVLGITKAALGTGSGGFISAASFQETTRILSKAAVFHKRDHLKGLKENVILGHIIPAGTAVRTYSRRRKNQRGPIMSMRYHEQALQVLTINYNWQKKKVSNSADTRYFNPIRLEIIRMLVLAYFHSF